MRNTQNLLQKFDEFITAVTKPNPVFGTGVRHEHYVKEARRIYMAGCLGLMGIFIDLCNRDDLTDDEIGEIIRNYEQQLQSFMEKVGTDY